MTKLLALGDLEGASEMRIKELIIADYHADIFALDDMDILIAAQFEDSYEGSSWYLLRDRKTGTLYENSASHCSCMHYENQWSPEPTTVEYLQSPQFYCYTGEKDTLEAIKQYVKELTC